MKHIFTCLLTALLTFTLQADEFVNIKALPKAENIQIFLSHPRTGTNWTVTSLEILTNRKVRFLHSYATNRYAPANTNRLGLHLSHQKPIIYRTHGTMYRKVDPTKNQLFMIIRDPRETIIRMYKLNALGKFDVEEFNESYKLRIKNYLRPIQDFDAWPEENRHCFYYEDLVQNPEKTFSDLLDFLKEPKNKLSHFIENIDKYSRKTRQAYNNQWKKGAAGSMSKGKDVHYHAKTAPQHVLDKIVEGIREEAGEELYQKYLSHYFEETTTDADSNE